MNRRQLLIAIVVLVAVLCVLAISLGLLLITSGHEAGSAENQPDETTVPTPATTPVQVANRTPTPVSMPANETVTIRPTNGIMTLPTPTRDEALSYLTEVAIGPGTGDPDERLLKWNKKVIYIQVSGDARSEDLAYLGHMVDEFNLLSTTSKLALKETYGDIVIKFFPRSQFSAVDPSMDEYQDGFVKRESLNYVITGATGFVGSDLPEKERFQAFRRALYSSLGFKNTAWTYQDSVFFGKNLGITALSKTDRDLIGWMYSDKLSPGMTIFEVRQALS